MIFVKDLGMKFQTKTSKVKRRMYLVSCPSCNNESEMQAGMYKAGYHNECKPCSIITKQRN